MHRAKCISSQVCGRLAFIVPRKTVIVLLSVSDLSPCLVRYLYLHIHLWNIKHCYSLLITIAIKYVELHMNWLFEFLISSELYCKYLVNLIAWAVSFATSLIDTWHRAEEKSNSNKAKFVAKISWLKNNKNRRNKLNAAED